MDTSTWVAQSWLFLALYGTRSVAPLVACHPSLPRLQSQTQQSVRGTLPFSYNTASSPRFPTSRESVKSNPNVRVVAFDT